MGNATLRFSGALLAVVATFAAVDGAAAQDTAGFFKGKTIKFVVGYGTGGGFDAYARMIAPPSLKRSMPRCWSKTSRAQAGSSP